MDRVPSSSVVKSVLHDRNRSTVTVLIGGTDGSVECMLGLWCLMYVAHHSLCVEFRCLRPWTRSVCTGFRDGVKSREVEFLSLLNRVSACYLLRFCPILSCLVLAVFLLLLLFLFQTDCNQVTHISEQAPLAVTKRCSKILGSSIRMVGQPHQSIGLLNVSCFKLVTPAASF